jgi:hypothetical protein
MNSSYATYRHGKDGVPSALITDAIVNHPMLWNGFFLLRFSKVLHSRTGLSEVKTGETEVE